MFTKIVMMTEAKARMNTAYRAVYSTTAKTPSPWSFGSLKTQFSKPTLQDLHVEQGYRKSLEPTQRLNAAVLL